MSRASQSSRADSLSSAFATRPPQLSHARLRSLSQLSRDSESRAPPSRDGVRCEPSRDGVRCERDRIDPSRLLDSAQSVLSDRRTSITSMMDQPEHERLRRASNASSGGADDMFSYRDSPDNDAAAYFQPPPLIRVEIVQAFFLNNFPELADGELPKTRVDLKVTTDPSH